MGIIGPGTPVPNLRLRREDGEDFTEVDLLGEHTTILVFYPFAFSPVCNDQLSLYEEVREELDGRGARLFGVSCDSVYSQRAFREKLGTQIEQLSDFEPKGEACRALGVYHPGGFAQRALVAIDGSGIVRWSHQAENPGVLPGANLLFDALDAAAA